MLVTQLAISFAIWIAFGWVNAKRVPGMRASLKPVKRSTKIVLAPAVLLGSAAGLFGAGFILMRIHGLNNGSLTPVGWLLVTFTGTAFVGAQTLAAVTMLSLATSKGDEK